jgi:hypothetical protein
LAALAASCLAQDSNRGFYISGTVTNSQTGQPVKQALVLAWVARSGDQLRQIPALTDGAGNFSLTGLGAGTYSLTVQKNGYTSDPGLSAVARQVGPSLDAVALRLLPLGKIAGKVTDTEGDAVPGVAVRALRAVLQDGRRSFKQDRSVTTDDRGQYRLWNLQPGEYYIVAAGRSGGTVTFVGPSSSGGVHEGFAPVYYPAASDRASATPIVMTPGQEFAAHLKIAMQPAFRVRGTLRGASMREPVKLELLRGAGEVSANRVLVNAATGRFEAIDVVPGTYTLRASQGKGEAEIRGERPVHVGRADVDGLSVELAPGVTVTGAVQGAQTVNARGQAFMMRCSVSLVSIGNDADIAPPIRGVSGDDGKVGIGGVHPGRYRVQVQAFGGYVASLTSGPKDLRNGAEWVIGPGTSPEPLEIVLRTDGGSISGTIDDSLKALDGTGVLVAPIAGGEAQRAAAYLGKFDFYGLAPGDYQVLLVRDIETIEFRNPELVRGFKGGEIAHVTAGGKTTITLKAVAQ